MKALIFLISVGITSAAWADLSQIQNVITNPEVQAMLPANGLQGVTVNQVDEQKCMASYQVNAAYPSHTCSLNVAVNSCGSGAAVLGPLSCVTLAQNLMPASTPSFAKDIQPLFQAKCTMCHGAGKMRPSDYTNYATAFAGKDALNQRVVVKKDMPMGSSMDQASRDLVAAWISSGAEK